MNSESEARTEAPIRDAFEHASIGFAVIALQPDGSRVIEVNRAMTAITGYDAADLIGSGLDQLWVEEERAEDRQSRERLLAGEVESYSVERRCRRASGEEIWCQVNASLAPGGAGNDAHAILQLQDISERHRFEQRLQYLADHDSLTGLLNRRRFRAEPEQQVSFVSRYGGRTAVLIADIDAFKQINDRLGHQIGDTVIRRVAGILGERVRETDVVARLSGDEFAVLMPQADPEGALQLAEDLRAEISEEAAGDDANERVTVSIGVTMVGGDRRATAEAVLVAADLAMYRAKEEGRDRVAFSESPGEPQVRARRHQTTSARIREAISEGRLSLDSQPILDLRSGQVERHELLLRMTENGGRALPAAAFIRAAEKAGMVQELDRWVVGQALGLLAERAAAGEPISVHINISGASFTDFSVLEYIERKLDEGEADPARITFEITESAAITNFDTAASFADRLSEFGCQVAIDDYGAGCGPFYYLKHLPFDMIKIDGDFVRDLPRNDADQLTVLAIVQIARGLGKRTIAGFVQDDETANMLRDYGVDMAQGFHLGRPVAVAALRN